MLVFLLGMAPAARAESWDLEPEPDRQPDGLNYSFLTPPDLDDVRVYDKSMPLPEVFRKLHEGAIFYRGYSFDDEDGVFPLPVNEDVQAWIDNYTGRGRRSFELTMARGGMYEHIILPELRKRGMPDELFYLCMIESAFNPRIGSWAGAKGLWQFIRATGQRYGLRIDYWVDERYDPEKSTHAALDYLTFLHKRYQQYDGSWHLAAAAYNTGEGNVDNAIQRHDCNNYWELCDINALHSETRGYVPKMVAAAIVGKHPEAYGFYNVHKYPAFRYATVTIDNAIDLRVAAKCAKTSTDVIERLNPELLQYCTPPGRSYKLHIPTTQVAEFRAAYAALSPSEKVAFKRHTVARGETLRSIASGYGTSSKMLAAMNSQSMDAGLSEGQELLVPVPPDRDYNPGRRPAPDEDRPVRVPSSGGTRKKRTYVIDPGDTLSDISRATGVSVEDLKRWNNIKDPRSLQDGDVLALYNPSRSQTAGSTHRRGKTKTISYTVRRGDTCYYIARYYGISTSDIREQNHLGSSCTLKPGQHLSLTIPSKAPSREPPTARDSSGDNHSNTVTRTTKTTYTVKKGDTISGIAKKFGVTVTQLKQWNNLKSNSVKPGQKLTVKKTTTRTASGGGSDTSTTAAAAPRGKKTTHTVKAGESLWTIARAYDVRVADIKAWNNLDTEAVKPGRKLTIYPGASAGASASSGAPATSPKPKSAGAASGSTTATPPAAGNSSTTKGKKKVTYTVKNGDNLWSIARAHDVHTADIKKWNNMSADAVKPGQKLTIYVD